MFDFENFHSVTTDQELWDGVRDSDELYFTVLFERYHKTMYNYGRKLSDDTAVVEDAVQDVFIDIWRLRKTLSDQVLSVRFYLYRALRRRIHVALGKFPLCDDLNYIDEKYVLSDIANIENVLIRNESALHQAVRVREMIAQLPERQIEAVTLRYFDDFSIVEIAMIMSISEKSVRNLIYKALAFLRHAGHTTFIPALLLSILSLA